jgi:hypothetical protein
MHRILRVGPVITMSALDCLTCEKARFQGQKLVGMHLCGDPLHVPIKRQENANQVTTS